MQLLNSKNVTFVWEYMFTRSIYQTGDMEEGIWWANFNVSDAGIKRVFVKVMPEIPKHLHRKGWIVYTYA